MLSWVQRLSAKYVCGIAVRPPVAAARSAALSLTGVACRTRSTAGRRIMHQGGAAHAERPLDSSRATVRNASPVATARASWHWRQHSMRHGTCQTASQPSPKRLCESRTARIPPASLRHLSGISRNSWAAGEARQASPLHPSPGEAGLATTSADRRPLGASIMPPFHLGARICWRLAQRTGGDARDRLRRLPGGDVARG